MAALLLDAGANLSHVVMEKDEVRQGLVPLLRYYGVRLVREENGKEVRGK
jgi:hypothetical protein